MAKQKKTVKKVTINEQDFARIRAAILRTWQAIASDLIASAEGNDEKIDNESAIECVLDADYMKSYGMDQTAVQLVDKLVEDYGYDAVLKHLSKEITLL